MWLLNKMLSAMVHDGHLAVRDYDGKLYHYGDQSEAPVIMRLNTEIVKALQTADMNERFVSQGGDPAPSTPDELRRYMADESARWAKTIKAAGIRTD